MLLKRGIEVIDIPAIDLEDLKKKLEQPNHYNSLFASCDTLIQSGGGEIVAEFSRKNKIPSFSCDKNSVLNGVLISYTADPYTVSKLAGKKAGLILRGADTSWLHTSTPEQGYLIINLTTAKLLGISIPDDMLKSADYLVKD